MSIFKKTIKYFVTLVFALVLTLTASTCVFADADHSEVASTSSMGKSKEIVKYGMVPIYGRDIADGTYDVEVLSSSAFFKISEARLIVKKGKMKAVMTVPSHSYLLVYPGTGEEAAAADASQYIELKNKDYDAVFTMDIESLNAEFKCSAFSKRKKKWYDRNLLIDASSLPAKAVAFPVPSYDDPASETPAETEAGGRTAMDTAEPMALDIADGQYSIAVDMTGGSGRASISSPTLLIVEEGKAYAQLIWSSSYYDYMIVGGTKYKNETTDGGNSTFTIPVSDMDSIIPVIADTTAMGDPVPIDYSLTFYRESIGSKSLIPQEATKRVLIIALIIIIVGGIINHIVKKRLRV